MDSEREDNNRVHVTNISNNDQQQNIRYIYEQSEQVLNNPDGTFQAKAASLIELWRQLSHCGVSPKIQYVINLMDWAKLHTLNIVLSGEWKHHKNEFETNLLIEVNNCERELYKLNNSFSLHCKKLIKVIQDPWGNPTLNKLLNTRDVSIETEEFEFFMGESGYLVSMRLKKLCEAHCEDLALNLVKAYMRCCEWAESRKINMNLTEDQKRFMLDVYIALLYKYKMMPAIIAKLSAQSLKDGLEFVQRFAKKRVNISKLWKKSPLITHTAALIFCSTAVMQPLEESGELLAAIVEIWLNLNEKDVNLDLLMESIRRVFHVTLSARHIYIFCDALNKRFGARTKIFNIELHIRALTSDLNLLERQKNNGEDKLMLEDTAKRLAAGLMQLAEFLDDHIYVSRECVLTSFSLQPTIESLRKIEDLAKRCGHKVLDTGQWKCKLHPPFSNEDDLAIQCRECGDFVGELELEAALNTNTQLSEALTSDRLGLSPELCDDLAVIVCSPRYQLLSWLHNWKHLYRLCLLYLNDPERTKNITTELKFVEIDYSLYMKIKEEPCDEVEERISDPDYSEVIPKKKRGRKKKIREIIGENVPHVTPNITPKSDPEVLKTLRNFRRTFKRKSDGDTNSLGKIFIGDHCFSKELAQMNGSARYDDKFKYNTPYNFTCGTNRTFSELAFRAHEELLQRQGLYPPEMYYNHSQGNGPSYISDMPSTSKENKFNYFDTEYTNISNAEAMSTDSIYDTAHELATPDKTEINISDENNQIQEQHFILNEFTNEITISSVDDEPVDLHCNFIKTENSSSPEVSAIEASDSESSNVQKETFKSKKLKLKNSAEDISAMDYSMKTLTQKYDSKNKFENLDVKPNNEENITLDKSIDEKSPKSKESDLSFRQKHFDMIFTEENGKTKKAQKEQFKKNEGSCNKENSRFVIRKKNSKNSPEKISPRQKRSELIEELEQNYQEGDRLNNEINSKISNKINRLFQNNKDSKSKDAKHNSSQDLSYETKYKLKELRVVLHRLDLQYNKKSPSLKKVQSPDKDVFKVDEAKKPLKDKNLRVVINNDDIIKPNLLNDYLKSEKEKLEDESWKLNPSVVLQRLEFDKINDVKSVLANVPGLNDTELMRPTTVDNVVQIVQLNDGRIPKSPNTQTSTQVSPHIQRIGQPRSDKPETSNGNTSSTSPTKSTTSNNNSKPVTTQPSTLINILSQQGSTGRVNIISHQILRHATTTTQSPVKTTTTTSTTQVQSNSTPRIVTADQQIINQIVSPVRTTAASLKLGASSDSSRIVQFICQSSDGKLIPVTSFTPNRVVKVATTQTVTSSSPGSPTYDENYAKLNQTTPKAKNDCTENSETLPKFQQAFGKSVYQNNVDSTNSTNITNNVVSNTEVDKPKVQPKSSTSVNVKPIQGGVIYTRQMPIGQTINLIPQTRGQVFRIATSNSEQISLVKDTVIHNKMSALLAAALQGKKNSESTETESGDAVSQTTTRVALARPTLVQNARIVKPVLQIPSNVIRNTQQTNLSSTTLEQLREFDMVYKQVKERSSTNPTNDAVIGTENRETPPQRISVTYLNQGQKINCSPVVVVSNYSSLQPAASPALSVASQGSSSPCVTPAPTPTPVLPKVTPKSSKGKSVKSTTMHTTKASPIPKPQQKPQEDEHTTQRIFDILAEYAEQLRNSPDLNNKPAPRRRSNPPTNPSQSSKRKKSSGSKKSGQCSSLSTEADVDDPRTLGSEDSSCGVMQLSVPDDEQPSTIASTSESNDSTPRQQLILTDSSHNQTRNLIIADSSVGEALKMPNTAVLVPGNYIMPVSMVKGGQQIAVVSGGSKILATVPARSGPNMLLFQSFLNQTRKTSVPTVKYSTIQPITGISSQSLAGVSAQPPVILPPPSHGISTVTLGQPITVKKLDDSDRVNTELLLTISQSRENDSATEETPQPDSSTNVVSTNSETVEIEESATLSDNSSEKAFSYQKPLITTPIATPVIAQVAGTKEDDQNRGTQTIMTLSLNAIDRKGDTGRVEERVQSVLVTAGTSNGPMLSHSPPRYKQSDCSGNTSDQNKDDFLRNTEKRNSESKNYQSSNIYSLQGKIKKIQATGTQRLDRELQQLCLQRKQAALERELRLQKSLSEECEDLGVDEPSTSDLFPEAELLFDSNHSPSFDQTSQDLIKRSNQAQDGKEESKLTLFSDDDFLFEPGEYQTTETELEYDEDRSRLLTNGQSGTSTESSPCEDNTLLRTCTSMSDVTLNSPISPETYRPGTPPHLNKYVHKYSNRKKSDNRIKQVENWTAEVSSSEDTTGSTELVKSSSRSPELCLNKPSDEELSDGSFKVVRVAISKTECGEIHCTEDADCSLSGRGARRSVKKLCSCCNGSQEGASRKRPGSQPHTPTPHKKAFSNKKR